ncbi:uncharacterized protein LOC100902535 [Galendromus occidentalis]|uniref:Uncharacterized protein LOC100902535 n=1 Tax=Galendromus occidentalis TaxID=34638 RepID=A0AAJ6QPN6_9ACAR|nr:uncharacterized protein LOC100902535 [Galendromus occidentalis]
MSYIETLRECIRSLDVAKVRTILDEIQDGTFNIDDYQDQDLLQEVCSSRDCESSSAKIRSLVYMLVDFGIDPNRESERPPLALAIQNQNISALTALLQSSTDLLQLKAVQSQRLSPEVKSAIRKYQPGIWIAVQAGNIADVRRLINFWVRMDGERYGKTLLESAQSTGNDKITQLISGIAPSMALVHHVLARDRRKVQALLTKSKKRPNFLFDFRHFGGQGAPILYYAMANQDVHISRLLVNSGAQLFTSMRDADGIEFPVLFAALNNSLQPEMVEALIPKTDMCESVLQQLFYKGQGVLEVAIRNRVPASSFAILVERCGPLVLCQRNCQNHTAHDIAENCGLSEYCKQINRIVAKWLHESYPRRVLALHGYVRLAEVYKPREIESLPADVKDFLNALPEYWEWIDYLSESVYNNDLDTFQGLSAYQGDKSELFHCDLLWNARVRGDALPLLHKAVLNRNKEMVLEILSAMDPLESIDTLVDEYYRTALHYVHAMKDGKHMKEILALLNRFGSSDHCLDKFGKEPLDFKEHSGTPTMNLYLTKIRERDAIPDHLHEEIWRHKPRRVREYKVQKHPHPHAHSHAAPVFKDETEMLESDEGGSWNSCIVQ